ncbi:hypothetical protein ACJX0J_015494, partial [Zea mays]
SEDLTENHMRIPLGPNQTKELGKENSYFQPFTSPVKKLDLNRIDQQRISYSYNFYIYGYTFGGKFSGGIKNIAKQLVCAQF